MVKKSNFLKNLLTTASVLAVTASAGSAMAEQKQNIDGAVATLANGGGSANVATPAAPAAAINFANGDDFRFVSAHALNTGGAVTIGTIDLNGKAAGPFTIAHNVTLTSVIDSAGNNKLATTINNGQTLTLNGANLSGLGNLTLGSGAGGLGTLDITANNASLGGNIDSFVGANAGVINVNAANVVFNGFIGNTNAIGKLDIKAGKSATLAKTGDNKIDAVLIGDGSTFNIAAGANIASATIDSDAANKGILRFAGASTAAITKLGNANSLETVEIGSGTVDFSTTTDYKATKTHLTGANSVIQFSAVANSETDFTTAVNGEGKLIFAHNHELKGNIGAAGAAIGTVQVNDGKTLEILKDDGKLYANAVTSTGNTSNLEIQGENFEIHANIGTDANKFNNVRLKGNVANNATTFKLMNGKAIYGNVDIANTNAVDNILELYEGSSITGNAITSSANNGILSVKGDAQITGGIIKNANAANAVINEVRFDEAATLTVTKNTVETANGIDFIKNGTLALTEDANFNFNKALVIAKDTNGTGAITVNSATDGKTVTLTGAIGDVTVADQALRLLEVTGGADIVLDGGNAAIKRINIGSQDVELKLSQANGEYLINDFSHEAGKGTLNVGANLTLKTGTNLGNVLAAINVNNNTLTVGDGVNLSATDGIKNTAAGNGKLVFEGSATVSGVVGSNHTFGDVSVEGKGSKVDFLNKFNSSKALTISDSATATLRGEVAAAEINGAGANEGTVRFFNETELKDKTAITAKIGDAGNALNTVVLGGENITFGDAIFNTKNLSFSAADNELTATFTKLAQDSLQNTTITTDSKTRGHNIVLSNQDQTFDKSVGSVDNKFGNFTFGGDNTITVNHADFYAGIVTETNQKGTVVLNAVNGNVLNLGNAKNELNAVTFDSNNTTVHEGVWSQTIVVNANKGAIFKDVVASSKGLTLNAGSTALFDGSNAKLDTNILANAIGDGTVEFNDTTTISNTIGTAVTQVGTIKFTGTETANIANVGASLFANNINVGAQTFRATDSIELGGTTVFNDGSTIDLGSNNITLKNGNSRFAGTVTVKSTLNSSDGQIGQFIIDGKGKAATINPTNATAVNIFITDNADLPTQDKDYELFASANGGNITNITDGTVSGSNRFINWSRNDNTLTRKNNAVAAITADIGKTNPALLADAVKYGNANNTGDAKAFTNDISKVKSAEVKEAMQRITNTTAIQAPKVVAAVEEATNAVISSRMGVLSNHPLAGRQFASSSSSGIAAGDDHTIYGAWVSPFYNNTTQKELKGTAGFKSSSYGVTIGFDTQANADLTVGIAGSYVKTDMKHKNFKSGDKTKADSFLFSLYGIQQLSNDWFLQGHTSFSTSRIKNTEKRLTSTGNETAKGNFDTTSFTAELLTGYNYMMADAVVTPLVGASFTRVNDGGYKETGTTNQNLNITRKAKNRFEAILGLRAQMTTPMEGIDVTPEIHAFVKHNLIGKDAKVTAKHSGLVDQLTPKSAKAQRTTFNVGFGVNAISGMYEYGAGYDLHVAEKSLGHQGTIKVRLNF